MYLILSSHYLDSLISGRAPRFITDSPDEALRVARDIVKEKDVERLFICELHRGEVYSLKDFHGCIDPDEGPPAKMIVAILWKAAASLEHFFHDFDKKVQV